MSPLILGASRKYLQNWRSNNYFDQCIEHSLKSCLPSIWYGVVLGSLRDHRGNVVSMKVSGQTSSRAASEDDLISFIQPFGLQRIKDNVKNWESLKVESDSIMHHWLVPVKIAQSILIP